MLEKVVVDMECRGWSVINTEGWHKGSKNQVGDEEETRQVGVVSA